MIIEDRRICRGDIIPKGRQMRLSCEAKTDGII